MLCVLSSFCFGLILFASAFFGSDCFASPSFGFLLRLLSGFCFGFFQLFASRIIALRLLASASFSFLLRIELLSSRFCFGLLRIELLSSRFCSFLLRFELLSSRFFCISFCVGLEIFLRGRLLFRLAGFLAYTLDSPLAFSHYGRFLTACGFSLVLAFFLFLRLPTVRVFSLLATSHCSRFLTPSRLLFLVTLARVFSLHRHSRFLRLVTARVFSLDRSSRLLYLLTRSCSFPCIPSRLPSSEHLWGSNK